MSKEVGGMVGSRRVQGAGSARTEGARRASGVVAGLALLRQNRPFPRRCPPTLRGRPSAGAGTGDTAPLSGDRPSRAPGASACEHYCELIAEALGRGRNAMAIWQDLVDDHGFPAGYSSVRRFVSTLRARPAVEARAVSTTAP